MNLNTANWKEFTLSKLFTIEYGNSLELDSCVQTDSTDDDRVNFVARTRENNGVTAYVKRIDNILPFPAGVITVAGSGSSTLSAFVQEDEFYSGYHLFVLIPKDNYTKESKLFITICIELDKYKYGYGRQANSTLPKLCIKLPVLLDEEGVPVKSHECKYSEYGYIPDWKFMDDYIKSLHYKPITTKNTSNDHFNLAIGKWKEFSISSLLTIVDGSGITKEEIEDNEGELNAVQSGEGNNGVLGKIDKDYCISQNYAISDKPCLTVARSGSAGFVSYQPEGCVVGDSAKILLLPDDVADEKVYLFIQTILTSIRFKYAYGRKVTREKYLNEIIKLPVVYQANGKPYKDKTHRFSEKGYVPDWEFMKSYIGSLPYGDKLK